MSAPNQRMFPGTEPFLFGAGLYSKYVITPEDFIKFFGSRWRIDGHCPYCHANTVFSNLSSLYDHLKERILNSQPHEDRLEIRCARRDTHTICFHLLLLNGEVQKIGQFPALADIANDQVREYRRILGQADSREFSRAIGLATHGVGIGSFVYLRRIFERLISSRFDEFKTVEGWDDGEFRRRRMDDKIELVSKHVPEFLVRNSKIYGILSLGIHELNDDDCLSFFPVLRSSIIVILEEDKRKQEERARQQELEESIARFSPRRTPETPAAGKT